MAIRTLDKSEWQAFFDNVSKGLLGKRAEIEVASLALGDHIAAEWVPLLGIDYDRKATFRKSPSRVSAIWWVGRERSMSRAAN